MESSRAYSINFPTFPKNIDLDIHPEIQALDDACPKYTPPELDRDDLKFDGNLPIREYIQSVYEPPNFEKYPHSKELIEAINQSTIPNDQKQILLISVEGILNFLDKNYLIFKEGVDAMTLERIRNTLEEASTQYGPEFSGLYEDSKLRVNNITTCLNCMGDILTQLKTIFPEVGTIVQDTMKWNRYTNEANKLVRRFWKKEVGGEKLSTLKEYQAIPWKLVYTIYHQIVEHYKKIEEGGGNSLPTINISTGESHTLSEELIEDVFTLVRQDESVNPLNVDMKLFFLRNEIIGLIPNAIRLLAVLHTLLKIKNSGHDMSQKVDELLEIAMQSISANPTE